MADCLGHDIRVEAGVEAVGAGFEVCGPGLGEGAASERLLGLLAGGEGDLPRVEELREGRVLVR